MKPVPATAIEAFRRDPRQYESAKTLLDAINGVRAALEVGTYAEYPQYRRWGSFFVPAAAMLPGASAPARADFGHISIPQFIPGDSLHSWAEIPPDFLPDGGLRPSLHFSFAYPPTAGEVVTWTFTANAAPRGNVFAGAEWSYGVAYSILDADFWRDCIVRIPPVGLTLRPFSSLIFSVTRDGAATTEDPVLQGVTFAYQKGPFGSEVEP